MNYDMNSVYTQYFQKSKVFLYPLLKLKKGIAYVPIETYICWDGVYSEKDLKFLCIYHTEKDDKFKKFETEYLLTNKMLEIIIELSEDRHLYIFNFDRYKYDHKHFVNGKYSKFSTSTKNAIINFFGSVGNIAQYISSFLDPEPHHEEYANALEVSIESIQDVYEVCSIPDIKKETLYTKFIPEIKLFQNKYISLNQYNTKINL